MRQQQVLGDWSNQGLFLDDVSVLGMLAEVIPVSLHVLAKQGGGDLCLGLN